MEAPSQGAGSDSPSAEKGGPRFNLRFESGRGLLELAQPLDARPGRIESLELSLGGVRFPVDVTAGAMRFRTRRTQVRSARLRFDPVDMGRAAEAAGVGLTIGEPLANGVLPVAVRDEAGVIGFDAHVGAEGGDLLVHASRVRTVSDGPTAPRARLNRLAVRLGLELDETRGLWRWRRPVRRVLAEAFVTRGWRVPDERAADLSAPTRAEGALWLRMGADAGRADVLLEEARALAPALVHLARGEPQAAMDHADATLRGLEDRPGAERELVTAALGLRAAALAELPGREDELASAVEGVEELGATCLRLRLALRRGDAAEAARQAETLTTLEPLGGLAAEALVAASGALAGVDPPGAQRLVRRALARRPSDASLLARCIELAELADDAGAAMDLAKRALASPLPPSERARLASLAARALERTTDPGDTEPLWREALYADPDDPRALEGLGAVHARRGDREAAVVRFDRAAASFEDRGEPRAAAQVAQRAAELLAGSGRLAAAERRLERGVELDPADAALRCALARVRVRLGALDAASVAYAGLLDSPSRAPATRVHALVEAAGFHLDERADPEGAAPFVEALERHAPSDPRVAALAGRLSGDADTAAGEPFADADPIHAAVAAARADESPAAMGELAERLARSGELPSDLATLEALERSAIEATDRAAIAREAARLHREAGDAGASALALARAGAAVRDAATLRAAIDLAEDRGALRQALDVIDIALDVVGEGPARAGLLARREGIEARRGGRR